MSSRVLNIEPALATTCEWILRHPDYSAWMDPSQYPRTHGFLWIRGKPGAGKSTLIKYVYEHTARNQSLVISYFFNARGANELEKSVAGLYRSLICQLLDRVPNLLLLDHPLLRSWDYKTSSAWDDGVLRELFSHVVTGLSQNPLFCFVDALDECDTSQVRGIIRCFESLGRFALENNIHFFVCFSSRHYPAISTHIGLTLVLENQDGHRQDLENYISRQLDIAAEQDAKGIRNALLEKSARIFMWVALVVNILNEDCEGGRAFGLKDRLEQIPPGLPDLFRSIIGKDKGKGGDLLLSILWILYAEHSLSPAEYYYAMEAGTRIEKQQLSDFGLQGATIAQMKKYASYSSKGLAEVTESNTVQFIHESVRDFLIKDRGLFELWPQSEPNLENKGNDRLKEICYDYMQRQSMQVNRLYATPTAEHYQTAPFKEKLSFLRYAVKNCLYHANEAAITVSQEDFLRTFNLQVWIETYSSLCAKDHFSSSASIFYVLADQGHARLIGAAVSLYGPCVHVCSEREPWKYPLFVALRRAYENLMSYDQKARWSKHRMNVIDAILRAGEDLEATDTVCPQLLFEHANFQVRDTTPLCLAVGSGHWGATRLLLDLGANVDGKSSLGFTPLSHAVMNQSLELVELLLDKGADINAKNNDGGTALILATLLRQLDHAILLLNHGADANSKHDAHGRTALHIAVDNGDEHLVQLLLKHGADLKMEDDFGKTPGHLLLIEWGAEIDVRAVSDLDSMLLSPVIDLRDGLAVKLLLARGLDVHVAGPLGLTGSLLIFEQGKLTIVIPMLPPFIGGVSIPRYLFSPPPL
ncbi:hypothetical protein F4808DRAFT_472890 [Astrocystis sublimbata]|nr:hypothetical protein F4808DRAFT_472890 [Astrocystis sublimbata]